MKRRMQLKSLALLSAPLTVCMCVCMYDTSDTLSSVFVRVWGIKRRVYTYSMINKHNI